MRNEHEMASDASGHLVALASHIAGRYVGRTDPRAILLTGSAAEGLSDEYSDIDLILYYDHPPDDRDLAAARMDLGATDVRVASGRVAGSMTVEDYLLDGVECQLAHATIGPWEQNMASVLEEHVPGTIAEKTVLGLLEGTALHGHDLIGQWQARARAYPKDLVHATVAHYLRFFPLWLAASRWGNRDATIFYHQQLADTSLNLLGVLAGLNRMYFSTFQFKRLRHFCDRLTVKPDHLADRLDALFALDPVAAGDALEHLVEETVRLVERHLPTIDTTAARRPIGVRQQPWLPKGNRA